MRSSPRIALIASLLLPVTGCLTPTANTDDRSPTKKSEKRSFPRSLAFSPDGTVLAVGLTTKNNPMTTGGIRFLDAATLQPQFECELDHEVTDLTYSPDGTFVFHRGQRILWHGSLPPTVMPEFGHLEPATRINREKLSTVGTDWKWAKGGDAVHTTDRRALAWFSSDKEGVAISPLFPGKNVQQLVPIPFKTGSTKILALAAEHGPVAVVDANNDIQLVEPEGSRTPVVLSGHQQPIQALLFTADHKRLISVAEKDFGEPLEVIIWDVPSRRVHLRLPGQSGPFNRFFLSEDSRYLAIGVRAVNESTDLTVWDLESGEKVYSREHLAYGTPVAFSPDGRRLAMVDYSGEVMVLEFRPK